MNLRKPEINPYVKKPKLKIFSENYNVIIDVPQITYLNEIIDFELE